MAAVKRLARREGLFAEPASAASVAAIEKLAADQIICESDTAVGIITAHGLKSGLQTTKKEINDEAGK